MRRVCQGEPDPRIPQGGATAAVNGRDKSSEMQDVSGAVEYLLIDGDRVALRTADAGEARAYYLGSEQTIDVFAARLKWGMLPEMLPASDLPSGSGPIPGMGPN